MPSYSTELAKKGCPRLRDSASDCGGELTQPRTHFFYLLCREKNGLPITVFDNRNYTASISEDLFGDSMRKWQCKFERSFPSEYLEISKSQASANQDLLSLNKSPSPCVKPLPRGQRQQGGGIHATPARGLI